MALFDAEAREETRSSGRKARKTVVAVAGAALLISAMGTAQADTAPESAGRPSVSRLGTLPGGDLSWAYGINESNVITGFAKDRTGKDHAVRWDDEGHIEDLGALPGFAESTGFTINNDGTVAGRSFNGHVVEEAATVWDAEGNATRLPSLPGGEVNRGYAINDAGVVVGISSTPDRTFQAVRWDDGEISELPELPGQEALLSGASWINEKGEITGFSGTSAVVWDAEGDVNELEPLASPQGPVVSRAYAINDSGYAVGAAVDKGTASHAVRWSPDGEVTELPPLPGDIGGAAYGINNDGSVNGYSINTLGVKRAVTWDAEGNVTELNPRGPRPSEGYMINDLGVIVGVTADRNHATRGLVYTP